MIKASDLLIARRADTKARADFSTWRMMAKLNVATSLTPEAQAFLTNYEKLLGRMSETEAADATIDEIYKSYYAEMGGAGAPPDSKIANPRPPKMPDVASTASPSATKLHATSPDNVISLKSRAQRAKFATGTGEKHRLPVALIFVCLIIITVGLRYLLQ